MSRLDEALESINQILSKYGRVSDVNITCQVYKPTFADVCIYRKDICDGDTPITLTFTYSIGGAKHEQE